MMIAVIGLAMMCLHAETPLYRDAKASVEQRVEDLLKRMTVAEKAGQLTQSGGLVLGVHGRGTNMNEVAMDKILAEIRAGRVGSYLSKMRHHKFGTREIHGDLQKAAVEESRLGIPLLFADDMVHGTYTCFPNALGLACSFEPDLFEKSMHYEAVEARWEGFDWVYGPVADTARDLRWGRIAEGCGEDPYLNGLCMAAAVRGLQGDGDPATTVIATPKHFVGYSDSMGGRDYNVTDFSEWSLRNVHLPPFRAAVEAGALSLMSGFNTIDGVPASHCKHTLSEILRDQWGFKGVVISDAGSLGGGVPWGYCIDKRDSCRLGLEAGADIDMYARVYLEKAEELIKSGELDVRYLDACVRRFLRIKFQRGLFEHPYLPPLPSAEERERSEAAAAALAKECALHSAVLIKNDGTLPLGRELKKVAVIGPWADHGGGQIGCWPGLPKFGTKAISIFKALKEVIGENTKLVQVRACNPLAEVATYSRAEDGAILVDRNAPKASAKLDLEAVRRAAAEADVLVLAIGESSGYTGEGGSRATLGLTGRQQELFDFAATLGKPIISVVTAGRPLAIPEVYEKSAAVLYSFFLGCRGTQALADILVGRAAPEGRLSVSIPHSVGHLPCFYNRYNTGHPNFKGYRDASGGQEALYPFGFGMTYTKFEYGPTKYDAKSKVARCEIANVGAVTGVEKPQLYIRQLTCHEGARPVRELRGIQRIELKPGERRVVSFPITDETLRYHNRAGGYSTDKGRYELKISSDAAVGKMVPFSW